MDISKLNKLEDELSDMYRDLVGEGHVNDDLFSECMSDMVYEVKGAVLDEACRNPCEARPSPFAADLVLCSDYRVRRDDFLSPGLASLCAHLARQGWIPAF